MVPPQPKGMVSVLQYREYSATITLFHAIRNPEPDLVSGMATRGGTLYAQALHGDFGTIVVGRRGVSNVKTFPIGRVPMKLVQLIKDQTVWVVGC